MVPGIAPAWTGGLCWDLPAAKLEEYAREHGDWGYGIRRVDRDRALSIEPGLARPPDVALFVAEEGAVEPQNAAGMLVANAAQRGARFISRTPVTAILEKADAVRGVETAAGEIAADEVVLAAGSGTPALAAMAGASVPMTTPPGLLVHSRPCTPLLNGLVLAPELHMRQTAEGRIVAGSDFGGADPGEDAEAAAQALFAEVKSMLQAADSLQYDFHTVGYRPTPADGFPIVGRPNSRSGLYLAVMHSGITLAPAVGRFVAEEILAGRRDPLLAPYGPDRFG
jgi:glycine/D-amino acid oxidase-like deaminating enzyme